MLCLLDFVLQKAHHLTVLNCLFAVKKNLVCKEDRNGKAFNKAFDVYTQKLSAIKAVGATNTQVILIALMPTLRNCLLSKPWEPPIPR